MTNPTDDQLVAAFLAGRGATIVPEGKSVLEERKQARTQARDYARGRRESRENRASDRADYRHESGMLGEE